MTSIAVDSGPLVAFLDRRDGYHQQAVQFFSSNRRPLITNIAVLVEVCALLDFDKTAGGSLLEWVVRAFVVDRETVDDLGRIAEVMRKYADLPADFADASLLAMCERRKIPDIATFDSDFTVYRLKNRKALTNVVGWP